MDQIKGAIEGVRNSPTSVPEIASFNKKLEEVYAPQIQEQQAVANKLLEEQNTPNINYNREATEKFNSLLAEAEKRQQSKPTAESALSEETQILSTGLASAKTGREVFDIMGTPAYQKLDSSNQERILRAADTELTKMQAPDVNINRLQAAREGRDTEYFEELRKQSPEFHDWVVQDMVNAGTFPKKAKDYKDYILGLNKRWSTELEERKKIIDSQLESVKFERGETKAQKEQETALETVRNSLLTSDKSIVRTALQESYEKGGLTTGSKFIEGVINLPEFKDVNVNKLSAGLERAIINQRQGETGWWGGPRNTFNKAGFIEKLKEQLPLLTNEQLKGLNSLNISE